MDSRSNRNLLYSSFFILLVFPSFLLHQPFSFNSLPLSILSHLSLFLYLCQGSCVYFDFNVFPRFDFHLSNSLCQRDILLKTCSFFSKQLLITGEIIRASFETKGLYFRRHSGGSFQVCSAEAKLCS